MIDDVRFPDVHVQLTDNDGNVFLIIGAVSKALKRAGHVDAAKKFRSQALDAASYDDVLALVQRTVEVS